MRRTIAIVAVVLGTSAGCHTITEDMPARPTQIYVSGGSSTPVVVVPAPNRTVTPPPDDNSGGPRTDPEPNPGNGGGGEPPTTNRSPVVKLNAHVYFIECNGAPIPGSNEARTAPVGCRIHFDCTARDGSNSPTIPRGTPRWTYSNTGILNGGNSGFNPVVTATGRGCTDFYAEVDGVRSGTSSICFE
jgi:hypothetical protein